MGENEKNDKSSSCQLCSTPKKLQRYKTVNIVYSTMTYRNHNDFFVYKFKMLTVCGLFRTKMPKYTWQNGMMMAV